MSGELGKLVAWDLGLQDGTLAALESAMEAALSGANLSGPDTSTEVSRFRGSGPGRDSVILDALRVFWSSPKMDLGLFWSSLDEESVSAPHQEMGPDKKPLICGCSFTSWRAWVQFLASLNTTFHLEDLKKDLSLSETLKTSPRHSRKAVGKRNDASKEDWTFPLYHFANMKLLNCLVTTG